ncbi:MAG TPA: hypothetical protein VN598_19650 [Usitatibacter sp.]|nr:hypothetical protein [Usitatibacter sp.]
MGIASRAVLVAAVWALALACFAEEPAWKLDLKPDPSLPNGRVAIVKAASTAEGQHYLIENVFVLQPVVLTLVAANAGDALKLVLGKDRWDENLREAATGPDGKAIVKLRTQGEVRMTVSGEAGKPYYLIAWVGDEVKPDLAPVVTPMDDYRKTHPTSLFSNPVVLWGAVALLVAAAGAGLFFLGKRSAKK